MLNKPESINVLDIPILKNIEFFDTSSSAYNFNFKASFCNEEGIINNELDIFNTSINVENSNMNSGIITIEFLDNQMINDNIYFIKVEEVIEKTDKLWNKFIKEIKSEQRYEYAKKIFTILKKYFDFSEHEENPQEEYSSFPQANPSSQKTNDRNSKEAP